MSDFADHFEEDSLEFGDHVEEDGFDFTPKQYAVGMEKVSESGISHWLTQVDAVFKPTQGTVFDSIDVAYEFYAQYAQQGGFEVRKSTQTPVRRQRVIDGQRTIKVKYFVCSREGFKPKKERAKPLVSNDQSSKTNISGVSNGDGNNMEDVACENNSESFNKKQKNKRRQPSQPIGCQASFKLQITEDNKYELYCFVEEHNHCLVHPDYMLHLKAYRRLDNSTKTMLYNFLLADIGPTAGHRILSKIRGGHDKVGATPTDCRNFKRDINAYIGKADAQIMVDMLTKRKECLPNFSFEYFTDEKGVLGGFFWADEQAKQNYSAFGDVVSFDATFRSNKYNMVFIPFTGIDNHKKCVTVGAGMLSKEDAFSYKWLLNSFKKAFPQEPTIVLTDQDPAMKIVVEDVFKTAHHRLCMWHIMEKLSTKVGAAICNSGLKARLAQIVWTDKLQSFDFEKRWGGIMRKFNLQEHQWLADMFNMRYNWIPAYFLQWNLSGLMRTSSRSESENHMFGQLMRSSSTLVEFLSFFDTAMQSQRFTQSKNDHESEYTTPHMDKDASTIEKDVARIYTRAVFFDMQMEIQAANKHCLSRDFSDIDGCKKYTIVDRSVKRICIDETIDRVEKPHHFDELIPNLSQVDYKEIGQEVSCSCRKFEKFGLLCRHIFYVLKICNIDRFPKRYICRRWTRGAVPKKSIQADININQIDVILDDKGALVREIYQKVDYCVNQLLSDTKKLSAFRDWQQQFMFKVNQDTDRQQTAGGKELIGALTGVTKPAKINVHPPTGIVNKGGGKRTRITSSREDSIAQSNKPLRMCKYCKIKTTHDIRNCPVRKADEAAAKAAEAAAEHSGDGSSSEEADSPYVSGE